MRNVCQTASLTRSAGTIIKTLLVAIATVTFFFTSDLVLPQAASAYPFWAQETYPESPRQATGLIVCANCHLAAKKTEVEIPQSVLPDTVFKAVVKIPYDTSVQQVGADGSKAGLNVGAVLMLPEGFKIAPEERIPEEWKEEIEGLFYQPYTEDKENVVIIGPLPGEQYQEIVFPVLSPNPATDKNINFGKYAVHVGGNRGRGQVYPTGQKSNNTVYTASAAGTISKIAKTEDEDGNVKYELSIQPESGDVVVDTIPVGPELIVSEGQVVKKDEPLTNNPNVGGFGQDDGEIVLQDASRVQWMIAFVALVMLAQVMLVLKKKQVEKVQAAEMNF
ncbi:MAG: apocytochrome f [Brasilonema octagenarum HA4186-MV1]|jgi:apocytochrome f|uniref:Cytochrome f n=2 Tax=Brasilonema TaxID=383614 RepID=A0A856MME6_9CYAN|nr:MULTISPECIES: apocytochrome f [Brasilonema]MBW4629227.1 apocytochrome f [Brasilonema octagenarum HA4186-MV1]NMF65257.1 apocytochrome f [Brasilonema octagenarum UFV-OR1]QDL11692.1 apocytochrome f [Brasilonema sennae CENA114]QDL18073.1 apocytochrome f [Brasilonema octagenarum UFV-E1]